MRFLEAAVFYIHHLDAWCSLVFLIAFLSISAIVQPLICSALTRVLKARNRFRFCN